MPVQRVKREHERPGRTVAGVQDLADRQRGAARLPLLGDVEIGPQHQPHARDLTLGRPGEHRDQFGAGVKRVAERPVTARRGGTEVLDKLPQAARLAIGRSE
jgi:hypothetical protein